MTRQFVARGLAATFFMAAALLFLNATPAHAQLGAMHGRVVDEGGAPVPDVDISYDFVGEETFHFTGKTDAKGNYNRGGLRLPEGKWTVTARKGNLSGGFSGLVVPKGNALQVPDIVLKPTKSANDAPSSKAKVDLVKAFADVKTLMAAGSYDDAITKLNDTASKADKCGGCYVRLGDAYLKKSDLDNAEKSYLKTIEFDDKSKDAGEAYSGLVEVYTKQAGDAKDADVRKKKLDDAGQANTKAQALTPATPGGAGGGDPTSLYNGAVILFNQGKLAEAGAQFKKVIDLDPNRAEAYYYYGLSLVNDGKNADAKTALQKYLQLAPTGPNAANAKQFLTELK